MKDRITLLIKAKNLTAAQFADEIGVQKSSISHILSGRNNASLDFIQKILLRFPEVRMEWLMFGKGPIFNSPDLLPKAINSETLSTVQPAISVGIDLFSAFIPDKDPDFNIQNNLSQERIDDQNEFSKSEENESDNSVQPPFNFETAKSNTLISDKEQAISKSIKTKSTKSILKIVEFYSNNTYREFYPE
jgi:transcriptional regulator with XRE-family HTH domain